jgi:peroxiredoxin Q/BCP
MNKNIIQYIFPIILLLSLVLHASFLNGQDNLKLKEGMEAPDFTLQDYKGNSYKLSSFKEKSLIVIYFYPKAGTSGCTKQACDIRDDLKKFKDKKIVVIGISTDSKSDLKEFIRENNLQFPLLSDDKMIVASKYGVLRDNGKAKRITFIMDKKGIIAKILEVKDVSTHSKDVYKIASQL